MLKVTELAAHRTEKGRVNHETYKAILQQCYAVITATNNRHLRLCRFMVPSSMPGRAVYTQSHATSYVTAKLQRGGFTVFALAHNAQLLHIQWDPLGKR